MPSGVSETHDMTQRNPALLHSVTRMPRTAREKYMSASLAAYRFLEKHSDVILCLVGIAIIIHGIDQLAHAGGLDAAGNGSRGSASEASGGGTREGAGASGGAPIYGNAVQACSRNVGYLEGGFGTLVASAAGIGAIISAAVGGFKAAWTLFVVSVGCFIMRTFLYLFLTGC